VIEVGGAYITYIPHTPAKNRFFGPHVGSLQALFLLIFTWPPRKRAELAFVIHTDLRNDKPASLELYFSCNWVSFFFGK
jgi:hypothetical protein